MIVLGSASPRRKELFEKLGIPFVVAVVDVDESIDDTVPFPHAAQTVAMRKVKAARLAYPNPRDCVITADTIVIIDSAIVGKPVDYEDAYRILSILSGRRHSVITGVCIDYDHTLHVFSEETRVHFSVLSKKDITEYLMKNDYSDKAGAYGIQGNARFFVEKIIGDYYNVVGFPMNRFLREFRTVFGKDVTEL